MSNSKLWATILGLLCTTLLSAKSTMIPLQNDTLTFPEWAKSANIYELNVRQYTPEGNFKALYPHLRRLKALGTDIIWFMPLTPISKEKRKGSMGSPYASSDYKAINPDYGTKDDFNNLVRSIHQLGMKVIVDWVPNHTGWDHVWLQQHPEWYTTKNGHITEPLNADGSSTGWTDVADLNYDNPAMREAMIDAMAFWLIEFGIDGFRVDMAGMVPNDFWVQAGQRLRHFKKDVYMLSEWEDTPEHFTSFAHTNYGWQLHHATHDIAQGKKKPAALWKIYEANQKRFPKGATQLLFITNHDENSWNGTAHEKFGAAADAFAVFNFTFDGVPLVYSGQEIDNRKRLSFFEKDTILWEQGTDKSDFYRLLATLKHENEALWNGVYGAAAVPLKTGNDHVLSYARSRADNTVLVFINASAQAQSIKLKNEEWAGEYLDYFAQKKITLAPTWDATLPPWQYLVLVKK